MIKAEEIIKDYINAINTLYLQGIIKDTDGKVSNTLKAFLDLYNELKEENRILRKCHLMYEEMTGVDLLLKEE